MTPPRPDAAATPNIEDKVATLTFGLTVRGMVRSVKEDGSCTPIRWLVTIVPRERRERL